MELQNKDVYDEIKVMLKELDDKDQVTHNIIVELLKLVFQEYNSGRKQQIEKKLYELIDAESKYNLKKTKE